MACCPAGIFPTGCGRLLRATARRSGGSAEIRRGSRRTSRSSASTIRCPLQQAPHWSQQTTPQREGSENPARNRRASSRVALRLEKVRSTAGWSASGALRSTTCQWVSPSPCQVTIVGDTWAAPASGRSECLRSTRGTVPHDRQALDNALHRVIFFCSQAVSV